MVSLMAEEIQVTCVRDLLGTTARALGIRCPCKKCGGWRFDEVMSLDELLPEFGGEGFSFREAFAPDGKMAAAGKD